MRCSELRICFEITIIKRKPSKGKRDKRLDVLLSSSSLSVLVFFVVVAIQYNNEFVVELSLLLLSSGTVYIT